MANSESVSLRYFISCSTLNNNNNNNNNNNKEEEEEEATPAALFHSKIPITPSGMEPLVHI
jgi:hypothetical protein